MRRFSAAPICARRVDWRPGRAYLARPTSCGSAALTIAEAPATVLSPEQPRDAREAEALVERAFGPGRYAKAAERLREGNHFLPELSFTARVDGAMVGTVRMWPVRISQRPALLLGPIAVDADARRQGLGLLLVQRACEAAQRAGHAVVVLVGDLAFFERGGFERLEPGRIRLPGPADPRRILVRALRPGALDGIEGEVALP
jgi:predicted N-acetyltransferase YhbS